MKKVYFELRAIILYAWTFMTRRDIYHDIVRQALLNDGWIITHDPFTLQIGKKRLYADLGAERLISAEKASKK